MRARAPIRLELLLICVAVVLSADAWNPGFQLRLDCEMLVSGGSGYRSISPAYDGESIDIHTIQRDAHDTILKVEAPFEDVQLSRSCNRISFRKYDRSIKKSTIRIVSRAGEDLRILFDVRFYAWGSDLNGADCIAYVVGEDSDAAGYQSRGVWLLNMDSGEQKQIHPRGHEIAWAEFDRSFYIGDWPNGTPPSPKVQRYNLKANELEETSYHGVDFSPGGTYYHTRSYEGEGLSVYLRETNENITHRYSAMLNRYFNGNPNSWLNDRMIVFGSYRRMNVKNRIIDFDRAEAWEVAEEVVGFSDKEEKQLLTLVDGKVVTRKFEDVAKLIYSEHTSEAGDNGEK